MDNYNEQLNGNEQPTTPPAPEAPTTPSVEFPPQKETPHTFTTPQFNPIPQNTVPQNNYVPFNGYSGGSVPQFSTPTPKKKKKAVWPFVLIGIIVSVLITALIVGFLSWIFSEPDNSLPYIGEEYVAVMYIDSEISGDYVTTSLYGSSSSYNQVYFIDTLKQLEEDYMNVGLMLYINTPGGEVTATDELSRAIEEYKSVTARPVYAYFSDMAASGGYWLGCHADKIIASKFCTTGSIGVTYGTHIEISELLDKLGITVTELTAGDNKAMGSMYSPLTDEQKAMYEQQLYEMHRLFIDTVAKNRNLPAEEVEKIADGRIFLASKALEYKLIDEIGYWNEAQAIMIADHDLDREILFYDCIPKVDYQTDALSLLYGMIENKQSTTDADSVSALVEALNQNRRFMAIYN